ncbi:hypothetical protein [Citrobacter freundii]|uniref:hypothetical protein n=1 Tax=Citrobacter freundii TaxID=546 RepID=UPI003AACE85F
MECKVSDLVKRGHDQVAELKSSCGAVDVRDVAQLISDLATQLDVQLARSNALTAENAGLKNAAEFATADDMWEELGGNVMRYKYQEWYADRLKSAMEIPATSASLAEVRAQGIESGIDMLIAIMNHQHPAASQAIDILRIHAEHLRKGVQS